MGRNAKPLKALSKHLTKAEKELRQNQEVKLGKTELNNLKPPRYITIDLAAFDCWKKLIHEYKIAAENGEEIITSSDVGILAMYCKTMSEYEGLLLRKSIFEANEEKSLTIENFIKIDNAINKKMDMLIKLQDRLFLNPLAKIKNVPKKEKEKPDNPMEGEFGV